IPPRRRSDGHNGRKTIYLESGSADFRSRSRKPDEKILTQRTTFFPEAKVTDDDRSLRYSRSHEVTSLCVLLRRLFLFLEHIRDAAQRILRACGSGSAISLECLLQDPASHALYVRNKLGVRGCACNREWNTAAFGAKPRHLRDAAYGASAEIGVHLKVKRVVGANISNTCQYAKGGNREIDVLGARTVGCHMHIGAEVLNRCVITSRALSRERRDGRESGSQVESCQRRGLQLDCAGRD